jgi:integrase
MAYIVQRKDRYYVIAYDGTDPTTGRERRLWHPAGHARLDAEAIARRLESSAAGCELAEVQQLTLGRYLTERWMPRRRQSLQPTTAYRYQWIIDHYIDPALGSMPLRSVRAEHLDRFYTELLATGGRHASGLAPKTVYDVHVVIRAGLNQALRQHLVTTNVAHAAQPPRPRARQRSGPECWTAPQLTAFLDATRHLRLHPALHLAATTGMRRGEIVGLRWGDWNIANHRLSIARSRQVVGGRSHEAPVKTRSSRRCIDLDPDTETVLTRWQHRQKSDELPVGLADPIFTNTHGEPLHAESLSQLFDRQVCKIGLPRIRFHDLRHTHASLLVAAGVPIKVVSERLGHAHPGFTMATYQHVLPGMGADAARRFGQLLVSETR